VRSVGSPFVSIDLRLPGRRERQIAFESNAFASEAFRLQQSVKSIAYAGAATSETLTRKFPKVLLLNDANNASTSG
jgi:hypothetical protein